MYWPDVSVRNFRASADSGGAVRVRWKTDLELGAGIFFVRRSSPSALDAPEYIGSLQMRGDEDGREYAFADPGVLEGDAARYTLVFAPKGGGGRDVAEWEGVIRRAPAFAALSAPPALLSVGAAAGDPVPTGTFQAWVGNGPRVRLWAEAVPADRVRLSLRQAGLYRVTARDLADAGGWNETDAAAAIATTNLQLTCQGVPVAWLADGDGLLFYGRPADYRYAPENVYWVTPGAGAALPLEDPLELPSGAATNVLFDEMLTFQGTSYLARVSYSTLVDALAPYVAFGRIFSGENARYMLDLPDCAPGDWNGVLTANLLSYYAGDVTYDCLAQVSLGGTVLGTAVWTNEQYVSCSFPFSSTNLGFGPADLLVENLKPDLGGTDYSSFLCVSFDMKCRRLCRARNDALRCVGGKDGGLISVGGFADPDILALDVTDSNVPRRIQSVTAVWDQAAAAWSATFADGGGGRVYHVSSRTGVLAPAVRGVRDTDWSAAETVVPRYAILIPPEGWRDDFRAELQPLADHRNAQGLRTEIIDVERLYNAFSYGLVDPLAIRQFCEVAHPRGLSYLLLAGSGSPDYKHLRLSVNDSPACLIPTLIAGQRFATGEGMTVALDAALGDADGDGRPEVAVGRLPTSRTTDLATAVGKTIAYEKTRARRGPVFLAADWNNVGDRYYPFDAGADRLLAPLAVAGKSVVRRYLTDKDDGARARTEDLLPALRGGVGLFHFFGHTDEQSLGGEQRLLYYYHADAANWQKPAIAVVMGCRPNRWQALTTTFVILPYGLFAAGSGFAACMGATGYMLGSEGEEIAVALYADACRRGVPRLGDMLLRGLRACAGTIPEERLLSFSLIGDPALEVGAAAGTVVLFR